MNVVNFKKHGDILPSINYIEISPVDKEVAAVLFQLAEESSNRQHWVEKDVLDKRLDSLSKEGLEARILAGKNPFNIDPEESPQSVIYCYDAEGQLVKVTPTPFSSGSEVEKYFAIKSQDYVGTDN